MRSRKFLLVMLSVMVLTAGFAVAGDFKIQYPAGTDIFTVATNGDMNATGWVSEKGMHIAEWYVNMTGDNMTGDLSFDTGANIWMDNGNINMSSGSLYVDGGDVWINGKDVSKWLYNQTIAAGTDYAYNQTLESTYLFDDAWQSNWTATGLNYNQTIDGNFDYNHTEIYNNTMGALIYNYTAVSGGMVTTNIAFLNNSQTFAGENLFDLYINLTKGARLMADTSVVTRDGGNNFSIDSGGNVLITLS